MVVNKTCRCHVIKAGYQSKACCDTITL